MALDTLKGFVPALLATIYVGHLAGVIAAVVWIAVVVLHRPNITRLRAGTETRFRFRRPATR
jgi:glycerol-3-phosphate acyltransferase PlsY